MTNNITKPRPWTPAELDWLRHHYPDTPPGECMAYLGRGRDEIRRRANKMGLRKSSQYMATERWNGAEYRAKLSRAKKELMASERRRWKNDLPQKTRYHFGNQGEAKINWRGAMRKAGYLEFADAKNRMYYPDGLKRHPRMEANGKRHNVVVLPMSERMNR